MRIVAGQFARRTLIAPAGLATRPTSDKARAAIFNIVAHNDWGREPIEGRRVLDACCGTGALALEALSRGAAQAWLMENDAAALQAARRNIAHCGAAAQAQLLRADALRPPAAAQPCDLAFLDPPYRQALPERIVPALGAAGWFAPDALLVVETARDEALDLPPVWNLRLRRDYGAAAVWFFMLQAHA